MMTVRFPNGQAIQYNTATYATRFPTHTDIYERKDGRWIAQVPNTCLIEVMSACRVYNPLDKRTELESITKELRSIKRKLNKTK